MLCIVCIWDNWPIGKKEIIYVLDAVKKFVVMVGAEYVMTTIE